MRPRASTIAILAALAALLLFASPASASFGLHGLHVSFEEEDGSGAALAGSHPFAMQTAFSVDTRFDSALEFPVPEEDFRDLTVDLPPGFVADRNAVTQCTTVEFRPPGGGSPECRPTAAIGSVEVELGTPGQFYSSIVYNLVPPPGSVAKFGFEVIGVPVTVEAGLSTEPPYHAVAHLANIPQVFGVYSSRFTLWGTPADSVHDAERGGSIGGDRPFLTMPRSCTGVLPETFSATSWQGSSFAQTIAVHGGLEEELAMSDCQALGFGPTLSLQPTARSADSPSGLDATLEIKDPGLQSDGRAQSDMKKVVVALPEGVTANPSLAEGLGTCSEADLARESLDSAPGEGCPQSSKIGTVEAESPVLEGQIVKGQLFIASQDANPFHSLLALYMVLKDPGLGILVKLPAKIEPDPRSGRLVTTFGEAPFELPQVPISQVRLHLREGGRSPLVTPQRCGEYTTEATITPWSDPASPYTTTSSFKIDSGVGGAPCPSGGTPPFEPGLQAGTINNQAGAFSPLFMRLTRRDGDQDLTRFSFTLPPGLLGSVSGLLHCSDAAIATARERSGRSELAAPSCPAGSQIGTTLAGAGVGNELTYVPGSLYLAGPYNGDPLSVAAIVPAVAGPFDVGTVVVRVAIKLNSETAQLEVDGANSQPIPHILAGIPLRVRDVRVFANREHFTLNPTACDPFAFQALLWGGGADPLSAADDAPVSRQARFEAANCAALGFKPSLKIALHGGTRRGAHPALRAVVRQRAGDANFAGAVVTLPRSAFLDQGHIRTICTRVQFAAHACPPGSVYGHAVAYSPLLDEPAEGPVYLRSSNHKLPDLVVALKGPPSAAVEVELVGRLDSHRGGIRTSFEAIPDVPVSRFVLSMKGGDRGLIVNSRNLCAHVSRVQLRLSGQNGGREDSESVVGTTGC